MSEEKSITIKKSDLWKYSTFILLAVVIIGGLLIFSGDRPATGNTVLPPSGNTGETKPITINEALIKDYPTLGDSNAPITILEFSDFLCSFCGRHHTQTLPLIKENYIDKGLVKYVLMDFVSVGNPSIHEAAKCVRELGGDEKFFEMVDLIYSDQQSVYSNTEATLTGFATQLGISESEFATCWNSGKYRSEVDQSTAYGRSLGIQGTPGFIVNDELISGAQPYSIFQQAIESKL